MSKTLQTVLNIKRDSEGLMKEELRDRISLMQRLNNRPPSVQERDDIEQMAYLTQYRIDHPNGSWIDNTVMILVLLMVVGSIGLFVKSCVREPMPAVINASSLDCYGCHRKMALTNYLKQAGSHSPEELANAVLKTESPRLLSAIAVVESNGNPALRNTGYKKRHHGAFQVNPRHWGNVSRDATQQAKQAENILKELTEDYPIKTALSKYGGDSTDRYQRRVLAELARVP